MPHYIEGETLWVEDATIRQYMSTWIVISSGDYPDESHILNPEYPTIAGYPRLITQETMSAGYGEPPYPWTKTSASRTYYPNPRIIKLTPNFTYPGQAGGPIPSIRPQGNNEWLIFFTRDIYTYTACIDPEREEWKRKIAPVLPVVPLMAVLTLTGLLSTIIPSFQSAEGQGTTRVRKVKE